jgi:hypothetical protein
MSGRARRRWLGLATACLLTVGLMAVVLRQVDPRQLRDVLVGVEVPWLVAAVAVFLGYQGLRTWRLRLTVPGAGRGIELYPTVCLQGLINMILPTGMGEVAMVVLLRNRHGIRLVRGGASVLLLRSLELGLYAASVVCVLLFEGDRLPNAPARGAALLFGAIVLLPTALLLAAGMASRGGALVWPRWAGGERVGRRVADVRAALGEMTRRHTLLPAMVATLGMLLAMYAFYACCVRALSMRLTLGEIFLLYVIVFSVNLIPVKGFANVGTFEAAWLYASTVLGVPAVAGATLAVGAHVLVFVAYGVSGLVAWLGFAVLRRSGSAAELHEERG